MIAIEISLNGKRLYVAGTGQPGRYPTGNLSAAVSAIGCPEDNSTLTMNLDTNRMASDGTLDVEEWPCHQLMVGDEVSIRIVNVADCDKPTNRRPLISPSNT